MAKARSAHNQLLLLHVDLTRILLPANANRERVSFRLAFVYSGLRPVTEPFIATVGISDSYPINVTGLNIEANRSRRHLDPFSGFSK